jgi:hypothetical protein
VKALHQFKGGWAAAPETNQPSHYRGTIEHYGNNGLVVHPRAQKTTTLSSGCSPLPDSGFPKSGELNGG